MNITLTMPEAAGQDLLILIVDNGPEDKQYYCEGISAADSTKAGQVRPKGEQSPANMTAQIIFFLKHKRKNNEQPNKTKKNHE